MPASPPEASRPVLLWFRRDLRLSDNPALQRALASGRPIVPVYISGDLDDGPWPDGAAVRWWLHHSLHALETSFRALGSRLIVRRGAALPVMRELLRETGADIVCANARYEPARIASDAAIGAALECGGIECTFDHGSSLFAPGEIVNRSGAPYRVFTPFWNACRERLHCDRPMAAPKRLSAVDPALRSDAIDSLGLLPRIRWDQGLAEHWEPGENAAQRRLQAFIEQGLEGYAARRDRPDLDGSSRLSPHLHFGELGPRQIVFAAEQIAGAAEASAFVRQLGWREFSCHLLVHFPQTPTEPLDARYALFPWRRRNAHEWQAFRRGETGFPLVDAGLRQLRHSGWMHNRVRMVVASFLTKNLRRPWLDGARWFWDTLVDADLANNTQGWQWTAGCGADAAPFFRVFNPVTQGLRYDPDGDYVRRWIPELRVLAGARVHEPWRSGGVNGYPAPIVDLARSRVEALDAYTRMRACDPRP